MNPLLIVGIAVYLLLALFVFGLAQTTDVTVDGHEKPVPRALAAALGALWPLLVLVGAYQALRAKARRS